MTKKKGLTLYNYLMLIGLVMIVASLSFIVLEYLAAKGYCESINGSYNFGLKPIGHYCNGKPLVQYSDGFSFERPQLKDYNFSNLTVPTIP